MKPCTRFNLIQSNIKENPVEQNLLTKEFTIKLDENCVAFVKYKIVGNDIYDLVHSSIPEQCQGIGLGHILAKRVFAHLQEQKKKVYLTCHFLQKCYMENPKNYSFQISDSRNE